MSNKKSVIMIGGGIQEIKAVEIAQSSGYKVIVTDRNRDAPCFPYADYTAVIDGRDIEGLIAYTLLNKEKLNISGVFTLTELVTSVAAVASAADLPGVPVKSAVLCQNKQLCKRVWVNKGIETPQGREIYSKKDAINLFHKLKKKVFIKPIIGFGGTGGKKIFSEDKLNDVSLKKTPIIMEEYIDGSMHDVNGLIDINGEFHPLGIVDRFFLKNFPVEKEIRTPSVLKPDKQKKLYDLLERGVRALGINWGPVKGDTVLDDQGFRLLEVAPRLHGPKNSLYLLPSTGINILEFVLRSVLTDDISTRNLNQNKMSVCTAILPKPGRIVKISGIQKALEMGGVEEILLFVKEGDIIREYKNSTHVPAYVLVSDKNWDSCERTLNNVKKCLKIETI